ncbi:hypothetical protein FKW77_008004 [Venturia effusa]|uniref:Uncharacterized protein n=1 Tax=Venturia effusa TaxID=50376 RepID=A0A517L9P2_9PEZI|nr:hypothetical protein FKW77_008004 [Venturia effusa]
MFHRSREGEASRALKAPDEKLKDHIKLQSDLARLGYTQRIKARLDLPKDYDCKPFTIIKLDFVPGIVSTKGTVISTGDVVTTFGFADDLVLNRHSRDFYELNDAYEDEDHDEFTLGQTGTPPQITKRNQMTAIYPPHTGERERYGGHSVQSETLMKYLNENPQAPRELGNLEGLPNPVISRNKKGVFVREAFLRKENEVKMQVEEEDAMDID